MNLLRDPWIPVRRRSGATQCIVPAQITSALHTDPIVTVEWGHPDLDGATLELLIGLCTSTCAPRDENEWRRVWNDPPAPATLQGWMDRDAAAFEMEGAGATFMQELGGVPGSRTRPIDRLFLGAAGEATHKNNSDVFIRRGRYERLGPGGCAIALFTLNLYASGGGAGHLTSLRGIGAFTNYVVASHHGSTDTLWGRIWPNVETREQLRGRGSDPHATFSAIYPWLTPAPERRTKEYPEPDPLQVYWAMPRRCTVELGDHGARCELTGEQAPRSAVRYRTTPRGIAYPANEHRHPLSPYYRDRKDGSYRPRHAVPELMRYREWLDLTTSGNDESHPAQAVTHWRCRRGIGLGPARMGAHGYQYERQSKIVSWTQGEGALWCIGDDKARERFDVQARRLADASAYIERMVGSLTVQWYAEPDDKERNKKMRATVARRFQHRTEDAFSDALGALSENPNGYEEIAECWCTALARGAAAVYNELARMHDAAWRKPVPYARGFRILRGTLAGRGQGGHKLYQEKLGIRPGTSTDKHEATRDE